MGPMFQGSKTPCSASNSPEAVRACLVEHGNGCWTNRAGNRQHDRRKRFSAVVINATTAPKLPALCTIIGCRALGLAACAHEAMGLLLAEGGLTITLSSTVP